MICNRCKQNLDTLQNVTVSENIQYMLCNKCVKKLKQFIEYATIDPNIYDMCEVHHNVTVEILENSVTGHQSIGWYRNKEDIQQIEEAG